MKKLFVVVILSVLLLSFSTHLKAGEDISFFANAGVITDDSLSFDPFSWYLGINLDFNLGDTFMLSPEANVVTHKFKFDTFLLQPAVVLNFKLDSFFVGAGIHKYFVITGEEWESTDFGLKLNAGFKGKNIRFRVFADMAFDSIFKDMLVGVQIGIGF